MKIFNEGYFWQSKVISVLNDSTWFRWQIILLGPENLTKVISDRKSFNLLLLVILYHSKTFCKKFCTIGLLCERPGLCLFCKPASFTLKWTKFFIYFHLVLCLTLPLLASNHPIINLPEHQVCKLWSLTSQTLYLVWNYEKKSLSTINHF